MIVLGFGGNTAKREDLLASKKKKESSKAKESEAAVPSYSQFKFEYESLLVFIFFSFFFSSFTFIIDFWAMLPNGYPNSMPATITRNNKISQKRKKKC